MPALRFVTEYHDDAGYIEALAAGVASALLFATGHYGLGLAGAIALVVAYVLDNCDGEVPVESSATTDGKTCPETITWTWTATDACGNEVTDSTVIVINDTTAPVLDTPPADVTVECEDQRPPLPAIGATDNCGVVTVTEPFAPAV